MSHRFTTKSQTSYIRNIIISLVVFLVIFLFFWMGLTSIQKRVNEEGIQTLQTAVTRSVTRCYAEEGSYPESLGLPERTLRSPLRREQIFCRLSADRLQYHA